MISALAIICCCYISGATGRFVPEITPKIPNNNADYLQEEELMLMKDIANYINQNLSNLNPEIILNITNYGHNSLESLNNKINESELYENAQEVKENNERSFVLINQKFKSQWFDAKRSGMQKNLFDANNRNHFELPPLNPSFKQKNKENVPKVRPSKDHSEDHIAYAYKPVPAYYKSYNTAPIHKSSGKEYIELLKKPLLRPTPSKMDNTMTMNANQGLFRIDNDDRKNEIAFFDDDQDSDMPKMVMQNDQDSSVDCNYAGKQMLQYSTMKPKNPIDNFIPTGSDSDAQLNQYLSDALRQQLIDNEVIKKHYNCYNSSCDGKQNKHQNSMYNGVMQGVSCLCSQSSPPGRLIQQEAPAPARLMRQGVSSQGRLMRQEASARGRLMRQEGRAQSRLMRKEGPAHGRHMLQEAPSQGMLLLQENAPQGRLLHQHPQLPGRLLRQDNEAMSVKTTTEKVDLDEILIETEKLCQLSDTITN